jgi:Caspase domain/WG containing repeat
MKKSYLWIGLFCIKTVAIAQTQNLPWLIQPNRDFIPIDSFSEGYAVVQKKVKQEYRFFYINKEGILSTDHYEMAYPVSNGRSVVMDKGVYKYRRAANDWLVGHYEDAYDFEGGTAGAKRNQKWGVIDKNGRTLIDFKYDELRPFSGLERWTGARIDNKVLIINQFGIELSIPYKFVEPFSEGRAAVTDADGFIAYIDTAGKTVIPAQKGRKFASIFVHGLAAVSDTLPHLSYIDRAGQVVFSFKNGTDSKKRSDAPYNIYQHRFCEGFAAVKQKGKWGFIDTTGTMVIPPEYEQVTPFSEGFAAVQKDKKWFFINAQHQMVLSGDFEAAKPCTQDVAWVKTAAGWGLLQIPERLSIVWENPFKSYEQPASNKTKVQVKSTRPLTEIRVEHNGQIFKNKFADIIYNWDTTLMLETGKSNLKVTASAGYRTKKNECVLYYQPPTGQKIKYHALLIANSNYDNWTPLVNQPIKDADSLATILYHQYQFKQIQILHDATLLQMQAALDALKERKEAAERILIFYAGHGDQEKEAGGMAYLIPVDAIGQNRKTQLSAADFKAYVSTEQLKSRHLLFIADACFAGSFVIDAAQKSNTFGATATNDRGAKTKTTPSSDGMMTDQQTSENLVARQVMTSGQKIEVPNSSVFIQYLFEQLTHNQADTWGADKLFGALKDAVIKKSQLVPQFGKLHHTGDDGGDFLLRQKIAVSQKN